MKYKKTFMCTRNPWPWWHIFCRNAAGCYQLLFLL